MSQEKIIPKLFLRNFGVTTAFYVKLKLTPRQQEVNRSMRLTIFVTFLLDSMYQQICCMQQILGNFCHRLIAFSVSTNILAVFVILSHLTDFYPILQNVSTKIGCSGDKQLFSAISATSGVDGRKKKQMKLRLAL